MERANKGTCDMTLIGDHEPEYLKGLVKLHVRIIKEKKGALIKTLF